MMQTTSTCNQISMYVYGQGTHPEFFTILWVGGERRSGWQWSFK